jgi:adenine-specific DNA-methyltransferase
MSKINSIDQLKFFLKEMFQFNANDLDFGIYRIYNLKRKEIENFIDGKDEQCLEPIINKTLELVSNIEKQVELTSLTAYLKKFNQESLVNDPAGNFEKIQQLILNFGTDDAEKDSLTAALSSSTKEFNITDEIKDKIYNHILGYFEMYYSNGDFGYNNRSRSLYKVPYEADYDGNDTMFHWKHKGSLYIKTGNSFNAIKFKLKHLDKEFELRLKTNDESKDEEVAQNNNKDSKLKHYKFNRFEEKDGITRIVFNLSDSSTTKADLFKSLFIEVFKSKENLDNYLFAEGKPVFNDLADDYDKVQDGSVKGIGALRVNRKTLLNKVNKNLERGSKVEIITESGQERFSDETLETIYNIDQKLNSFYIGNDSDYFIHENLQEFLTQEKERYIKNHILSDLKSILDGKLDNTTLIIAKAFELVSSRIIEFLSAIEEFQKKLFTMKKKVVESEYCLTIDNIDEKYFKEILENKEQLAEWENLFSVKVKTLSDLKAQPTLVLDTKFFKQKDGSNPFKDKILSEIKNLDERTNGLLINSENYQGLKFIEEAYREKINCIYIDPPYNTGKDEFIYKDNFRDSSWATMIDNRMKASRRLMAKNAVFYSSIDDRELSVLETICKTNLGQRIAIFIWVKKKKGSHLSKKIRSMTEYVVGYTLNNSVIELYGEKAYSDKWQPIVKRTNSIKDVFIDKNIVTTTLKDGRYKKGKYVEGTTGITFLKEFEVKDRIVITPLELRGPFVWEQEFLDEEIKNGSQISISTKYGFNSLRHNQEGKIKRPTTLLDSKSEIGTNEDANREIIDLFGREGVMSYPKPVSLIQYLVSTNTINNNRAIILDYFAGSGTTAHAVTNINEIEGGNRQVILIEMAKYFNNVLLERTKRMLYSSEWENGKPVTLRNKSYLFKYLVLEQYEDVLDAIEQFDGETPKNLPLKYLFKPELNKINSSLDLSKPFGNKIKYGQPTKEGFVDLVDTYNYLQGSEVKSIKTYTIGKKYYKLVETTDTLIIWRDIALGEDDSKAIKEIAEKYPEATQIEVNYDFNILATLKDKQLEVGKRLLGLNVIHADIFNQ